MKSIHAQAIFILFTSRQKFSSLLFWLFSHCPLAFLRYLDQVNLYLIIKMNKWLANVSPGNFNLNPLFNLQVDSSHSTVCILEYLVKCSVIASPFFHYTTGQGWCLLPPETPGKWFGTCQHLHFFLPTFISVTN